MDIYTMYTYSCICTRSNGSIGMEKTAMEVKNKNEKIVMQE